MKRHVLMLGFVGGVLIAILRWSEYQFLVIEHSFEIYGALVAVIFAAFGIWLGIKLTKPREKIILREVPIPTGAPAPCTLNQPQIDALGITPRELEILSLIAQGLSNREIAAQLFVSENTVKTHCSRTFDKLGARRRTQAVQLGKQLGLLPETLIPKHDFALPPPKSPKSMTTNTASAPQSVSKSPHRSLP